MTRRAMAAALCIVALSSATASAQEPTTPSAAPAPAPTAPAPTAPAKSKYGPLATPLSRDHAFLREAAAPDFWALMPHYAAQRDDRSCSLAAVCMLVNAARARRDLGAEDELATQEGILERTGSEAWRRKVGPAGIGVTLAELPGFIHAALAAYGVTAVATHVLHAEAPDGASRTAAAGNTPGTPADALRAAVHRLLVENERSASDFLLVNFNQGSFTSDADAGHIAPVAAYDEARRRVLILDPDRRWYEPYWVSEETFLAGISRVDVVSRRARGIVRVRIAE